MARRGAPEPARAQAQYRPPCVAESLSVIEMLFRLGLALLLSLSLALLLAWGWSSSDDRTDTAPTAPAIQPTGTSPER